MSKVIPDWALDKADKLLRGTARSATAQTIFARYIMEHEEEPVDPLVKAARALVALRYPDETEAAYRERVLRGEEDGRKPMQNTIQAIRCGMELAKEGSSS